MQKSSDCKFALNDLYKEIDFFDRKISYCQNFESFNSDQDREAACRKLVTKRGTLVKQAIAMAGRGIECDPKFLPRSLMTPVEPPAVAANE